MDYYLLGLKALSFLFAKTEVHFWEDYINFDIMAWTDNSSVRHHLQAYGTMGSINDIFICGLNKHNIKSNEEAWANAILSQLLGCCNHFAHYIEDKGEIPSKNTLIKVNTYKNNQIQGWRCLKCGYSELTEKNVDSYIAPSIVETMLNEVTSENEIYGCITDLLAGNNPLAIIERENMIKSIVNSDIKYVSREGWMRPCPNCNSEDTAVYRWDVNKNITSQRLHKLVPSQNNLPIDK